MSLIVAARFDTFEQAQIASAALRQEGYADSDMSSFFVNPAGQHNLYPLGGDEYASPGIQRSGRSAVVAALLGFIAGAVVGGLLVGVLNVPRVIGFALPFVGAYLASLLGSMGSARPGSVPGSEDVRPTPVPRGTGPASSPPASASSVPSGREVPPSGADVAGHDGLAAAASAHAAPAATPSGGAQAEIRRSGVLLAVQVQSGDVSRVGGVLRGCGGQDLEQAQGDWRDGRWVDFDPLKPPVPAA